MAAADLFWYYTKNKVEENLQVFFSDFSSLPHFNMLANTN